MFKIQFEIKSKMTAYVWAISGYVKHCLTKLAYEDLLKLMSQQLPSPNSHYTDKKVF